MNHTPHTSLSQDVLKRLKAETTVQHEQTEALAFSNAIRTKTLTQKDYQILLTKNWHIHQHLEQAFAKAKEFNQVIRPFLVKRSDWIAKDLGGSPEVIPIEPIFYSNEAELLGGFYVVEGSMLGGRYICKLLNQNPHLHHISTHHFFTGHDTDTRSRWMNVKQILQSQLTEKRAIDQAVKGAKKTFRFFQQVYCADLATIK